MVDVLIDNIFVLFGEPSFPQTIDIPVGTNCASLLVDLFLHAYETDFLEGCLTNKDRKLPQNFNSSFRYIDNVMSLNNSRFDYDLLVHRIYPKELEFKDTTDNQMSASYFDLHLKIDNGRRLNSKRNDKHDDFTFPMINFHFISSNIQALPAF
jgi:hypothetical protein